MENVVNNTKSNIWSQINQLNRIDKLDLIEKIIQQLKGADKDKKENLKWNEVYGIGKNMWSLDAQEYVDKLRNDRI